MVNLIRVVMVAALLAIVATSANSPMARADGAGLEAIKAKVARDYRGVPQMSTKQLAALLKAHSGVVLFDVREKGEYAVSHLTGAKQIEPLGWLNSSAGDLVKAYGGKVKGRTVVFYCSVGVRSSEMAEKVKDALMASGAKGVYNLSGGIFAWHNERRGLVDAKGKTDFVHPYDGEWGRLVERSKLTRFKPRP